MTIESSLARESTMTATLGIRMKHPAHPGGFVRNEIVAPLGLLVTRAAAAACYARGAVSAAE